MTAFPSTALANRDRPATHDQNVQRLCLQLVNPDDQTAVASVEVTVREPLEKRGRRASFIPQRRLILINKKRSIGHSWGVDPRPVVAWKRIIR